MNLTRDSVSTARWLTAPGAGAVAVLELVIGGNCRISEVCSPLTLASAGVLEDTPIGRIRFGSWGGEDVVVIRVDPDTWEIHCHGGFAATNRVTEDLRKTGVAFPERMAGQQPIAADVPGPDSVPDAAMDAESAIERAVRRCLPYCRTLQAAELVLAQRTNKLRELLQVLIAAEKDPGNDVSGSCRTAAHIRDSLRAMQTVAEHLIRPWRVALIGPPNVGKSSLVNALAGRERAIVSEVPGTTRDRIEADLVIDGWLVTLVDTAGLRSEPGCELEAAGIRKSREALRQCDLVLQIVDATNDVGDEFRPLETGTVIDGTAVLKIINKIDLCIPSRSQELAADIVVSARTGEGLDRLCAALLRRLVPVQPDISMPLPLPGLESLWYRN